MNKEQFIQYLHTDYQPGEESLQEIKNTIDRFPWFQTGWVVYLIHLKKLNHPDFESTLKKVALMVPDRKKLYQLLHNASAISGQPQNTGTSNDKPNMLIDRFLNTNPGIIRNQSPATKHSSSIDSNTIIAKSTAESDDIITETLANIYLQQKNYDKAIDAFQKLSLKYPEKSIYFASRIKEIEVIKTNT